MTEDELRVGNCTTGFPQYIAGVMPFIYNMCRPKAEGPQAVSLLHDYLSRSCTDAGDVLGFS